MTAAERAQVLAEALPHIRAFHGRTVVVKYGGAAMTDEALKQQVIADVVLMHYVGIRPVLVHGGGPEVSQAMKRLGKEPVFVRGLRVTDDETMEVVENVLSGKTNKGIVSLIHQHGGRAVGLSGKDGMLFVAEKRVSEGGDLGWVGDVVDVNPAVLHTLLDGGYIPVVCSVATGRHGETFNINADHVAGRLAGELGAQKLVLLTDVRGILEDVARPDSLIAEMPAERARRLISSGVVDRGMIPKVEACLTAIELGVPRTHILDGREPHSLLCELFTDSGVGTMIIPDL